MSVEELDSKISDTIFCMLSNVVSSTDDLSISDLAGSRLLRVNPLCKASSGCLVFTKGKLCENDYFWYYKEPKREKTEARSEEDILREIYLTLSAVKLNNEARDNFYVNEYVEKKYIDMYQWVVGFLSKAEEEIVIFERPEKLRNKLRGFYE